MEVCVMEFDHYSELSKYYVSKKGLSQVDTGHVRAAIFCHLWGN